MSTINMILEYAELLLNKLLIRFGRRRLLLSLLMMIVVLTLWVSPYIRMVTFYGIAIILIPTAVACILLIWIFEDVAWSWLTRNRVLGHLPGFGIDDWRYGIRVVLIYCASVLVLSLFIAMQAEVSLRVSYAPTTPIPIGTPIPSAPRPPMPLIVPRSTLRPIPPLSTAIETRTPESFEGSMPTVVIAEVAFSDGGKIRTIEMHVTLVNFGETTDLSGWKLEDGHGNTYNFTNFLFKGHSVIHIHSGKGRDSATDLYWNRDVASQSVLRGRMVLRDQLGYVVDEFSY